MEAKPDDYRDQIEAWVEKACGECGEGKEA